MKCWFKVVWVVWYSSSGLTNENESNRNDECEDITTDWLVVFAVSFGKEVQGPVDVVFTQCLRRKEMM